MKPFETEDDLRSWYKKRKSGAHFWCEAASGGTFGIPDVYTIEDNRVLFFELKVGEINKEGMLEFMMYNSQRIVLRKIVEAGGIAFLIVAVKGTTDIYLSPGDKPVVRIGKGEAVRVKGRVPHIIVPDQKIDCESFS